MNKRNQQTVRISLIDALIYTYLQKVYLHFNGLVI